MEFSQQTEIHQELFVQTTLLVRLWSRVFSSIQPPDGNRWLDRENEGGIKHEEETIKEVFEVVYCLNLAALGSQS